MSDIIQVSPLLYEEVRRDYPRLVATLHARCPDATKGRIAGIVSIIVSLCPFCHNAHQGCDCWHEHLEGLGG